MITQSCRGLLCRFAFLLAALLVPAAAHADNDAPTADAIKAAVTKSLPLLEAAARGTLEQRNECFTCHNQGLPIFAIAKARLRGFIIDADHLQEQLEHTAAFLGKNKQNYLQGKGQGGQVDTAGYALWTLDSAGWKPDATTAAVAEYLLLHQKDQEHYQPTSRRPPSEQSHFTSTYLALRGLTMFGTSEQRERIDARFDKIREWLLKSKPKETEDNVFRLWSLHLVGKADEEVRRATEELLKLQRPDGGFAQLPDLESDAYATGSALVALHDAGSVATTDAVYLKGLAFLIAQQIPDGSWHVRSRSKPFQTYFESGYPHEKDQFISCAAAGWSTTALLLSLPEK